MEKQMMIYGRAIPISEGRHRQFSVETGYDYGFAKDMSGVPLMAAEFHSACREYPIVFNEADGLVMPSALVGLGDQENAFVTPDQSWDADYIPAFIRRYPFVFAHDADNKSYTLCIDEGFDGCNQDGRGEPLFDEAGKTSHYLQEMLDFTKAYEREFQQTWAFCATLKTLGLLTPGQIKFQLADEKKRLIKGLLTVDRDRLKALPADKLSELVQSDDLEKIYAHLISLANFDAVAARMPNPVIGLH